VGLEVAEVVEQCQLQQDQKLMVCQSQNSERTEDLAGNHLKEEQGQNAMYL
jgi:ferritin-like protein